MFIEIFEKSVISDDVVRNLNQNITEKMTCLQNDSASKQQVAYSKFILEMGEIVKRNNSPEKENVNIQQMNNIFNKMYSTAEFVCQESVEPSVRFSMKRYMKPMILFECIDIEGNINMDRIADFYKWVEEKNCHSVFISQSSGFSSKPNYFIEYYRGNVIVFVHNAGYNTDKIKIAVDIIDSISGKLKELNNSGRDENSIPKTVLDEINKEYQLFISQKEALINLYKDCQKKVLSQIDEIRFPSLDKYLSTKYTNTVQKPGFKCDMCKSFNANNLKALAAHKRGCARKNISIKVSQNNEIRPPLAVL